ncbi:hypothetical protein [Mycoplasma parvum]|uniref:Uncharacterized protein n=1 Tax=Mycoplasma parvum str. Indiana TaxID=1403316 RepID=U5NG75_9MOLU|nr:hypothetical protein [Mycoplasma parvum]AGX89199.1 hypothetical protein PRV_02305 [Mycoplasma parvum str. Indiana]
MVRTLVTFVLPLVVGGAAIPTSYVIWGGQPLKKAAIGLKNGENKEIVFTNVAGKFKVKKHGWNFVISNTGILSFARGLVGNKNAKTTLNEMEFLWKVNGNGSDTAEKWKGQVRNVFKVLMGELWEKHLEIARQKHGQGRVDQFKFRSPFKCGEVGDKREGCQKEDVMLPMAWWDGKNWSARVEFAWKIGDLIRQHFKEFHDKKNIKASQIWEKIIIK